MTTITAHSGCEGTPRDSMESIDMALKYNADLIEVDVREDGNGTLRISHNAVSDAEYATHATLREVFDRVRDTRLGINCDMKDAGLIVPTLHLAKECGLGAGRLVFTGSGSFEHFCDGAAKAALDYADVYINLEQAAKFFYIDELQKSGRASELPILLRDPWHYLRSVAAIEPLTDRVLGGIESFGLKGLNLPYDLLTDTLAAKLNSRNIPFSVWTIKEPEEADRCLALGAANITTLRPSMVKARVEACN